MRKELICAWVGSEISVLGFRQCGPHDREQGAGTREAGATEIGLAPERTAGMSRYRVRGAASISDPIWAAGLVEGADQAAGRWRAEG